MNEPKDGLSQPAAVVGHFLRWLRTRYAVEIKTVEYAKDKETPSNVRLVTEFCEFFEVDPDALLDVPEPDEPVAKVEWLHPSKLEVAEGQIEILEEKLSEKRGQLDSMKWAFEKALGEINDGHC